MADQTPVPRRQLKKRQQAVAKHDTWQLRLDLKARKAEAAAKARRERDKLASNDPSAKLARLLRVAGVAVGSVIVVMVVVLAVLKLVGVTLDWPLVLGFLEPFIGWPLVVLALGVILRGEVASLLGRLAELKWGDKVASFLPLSVQQDTRHVREEADKVIEEAGQKAEEAKPEPTAPPREKASDNDFPRPPATSWRPHRNLSAGFQELFDDVEADPTGSVIRSFEMLTTLAAEVVGVRPIPADLPPNTRTYSPYARLMGALAKARKYGWVSDEWIDSYRVLRTLRNELAHGKRRVDAGDATSYLNAVLDLVRGLEAAQLRRFASETGVRVEVVEKNSGEKPSTD